MFVWRTSKTKQNNTWNNEVAALTIQSDLPELVGPLGVEVVPGPVVDPDLGDPDLEVTAAQVEVEVEVTRVELQAEEVSGLRRSTLIVIPRYKYCNW